MQNEQYHDKRNNIHGNRNNTPLWQKRDHSIMAFIYFNIFIQGNKFSKTIFQLGPV